MTSGVSIHVPIGGETMSSTETPRELKSTSYEIFILLLSILSLMNIVIFILPGMDPLVKGVISIMDIFITLIFMLDFLYRLFTADSKSDYVLKQSGWADLLSSLPFQATKVFRLFRVVKIVRLSRAYGPGTLVRELRENRAGSALFLTIFLVIVVLEFGGSLIVAVEADDPNANIRTAGDGVWWAFVTITTVGYGDQFPVTQDGRLVGMMTMMLGVGLFGVLTGFLTNAFILTRKETEEIAAIEGEAQSEINEFKRLLEDQERLTVSLKQKLSQIEATMSPEGGAQS
jgi:voltage-gated potassium channel